MTIMLFGSEMEFSTLKVHKLGANGQRTKICRALLFQAEVGSGRSPIIVTKGKGMMNSHLQNTSITIPLI